MNNFSENVEPIEGGLYAILLRAVLIHNTHRNQPSVEFTPLASEDTVFSNTHLLQSRTFQSPQNSRNINASVSRKSNVRWNGCENEKRATSSDSQINVEPYPANKWLISSASNITYGLSENRGIIEGPEGDPI